MPKTIGGHVGTVREVVSRTLHALVDAGAIRLDGRRVTLCERDLLARLARSDEAGNGAANTFCAPAGLQ